MRRLKRLWKRYNPCRTFIDCDDDFISFMSQLGYLELYRGEWFFTKSGIEAIKKGVSIANIRTRA
jgi:hypothetical protein